jgi:hypothetical protein
VRVGLGDVGEPADNAAKDVRRVVVEERICGGRHVA